MAVNAHLTEEQRQQLELDLNEPREHIRKIDRDLLLQTLGGNSPQASAEKQHFRYGTADVGRTCRAKVTAIMAEHHFGDETISLFLRHLELRKAGVMEVGKIKAAVRAESYAPAAWQKVLERLAQAVEDDDGLRHLFGDEWVERFGKDGFRGFIQPLWDIIHDDAKKSEEATGASSSADADQS